jgi:flagellar biosynthesis/type III secretory pathway M-ring protein FliF/YscJ
MLLSTAGSALSAAVVAAAEDEEFDPNTVTPGVVGFVVTFLVMVVVLLLVLDMVRRIRRVNYRAQVNEQLDAEEREAELDAAEADGQATDASGEAYDQQVGEAPDEPPAGDEPTAR